MSETRGNTISNSTGRGIVVASDFQITFIGNRIVGRPDRKGIEAGRTKQGATS